MNVGHAIVAKAKSTLKAASFQVRSRISPLVDVKVGPYQIALDLRDPNIARHVYLQGEWDSHLWSLIRRLDLAGTICLDIGANIGLYSMMLSEAVGPNGRVYAFEPERRNFELLSRTRDLNGARNVVCVKKAVAAQEGTCSLAVNPYNWGDHFISTAAPEWASTQQIDQVSIDQFLAGVAPGRVGFIKIDVQGYEFAVLDGMVQTLANNPQLVLQIEISPTHLRNAGSSATAVVDRLRAAGLVGWDVQYRRITPVGPSWAYELMDENYWADLIVSRDAERLTRMFVPAYGALADHSQPA